MPKIEGFCGFLPRNVCATFAQCLRKQNFIGKNGHLICPHTARIFLRFGEGINF